MASLARFLPQPPRLAVDVGGNVGEYTAALRARWPVLPAHLFEPAATNQSLLAQRFGAEPGVVVNGCALSHHDG